MSDRSLSILASQSKNSFQAYRKPTVWRRIQRRMGLNQMTDIADYARFLRESPDEAARLSKDMLIGVTSFFRDVKAFEELRAKVIAPLVEKKASAAPLRAWTAGCSTGEEVYSIAILLREEMLRNKKTFPCSSSHRTSTPRASMRTRGGLPRKHRLGCFGGTPGPVLHQER